MKKVIMLDTLKLLAELDKVIPKALSTVSAERLHLEQIVEKLRAHPELVEEVKQYSKPHVMPRWEGRFDDCIKVNPQPHPYAVVATDGSQIYPDKHQGIECYVINSGTVEFIYGSENAQVSLRSVPFISTVADDSLLSEDIVNCRRAEVEFEVGLAATQELMRLNPTVPCTFLCDGSLLFWHLENKGPALKERFLGRYIDLLDQFYKAQVPIAGYISLPKSKELMALCSNSVAHKIGDISGDARSLSTLVDTDLVTLFLEKEHRTKLFSHVSSLLAHYPAHLAPCFVYLDTGAEIARVEVSQWVAQDEQLFTRTMQIIMDQAIKGNGYPVALSEAHEQAVIKTQDRELFFDLLRRKNLTQSYKLPRSQKGLKKRFVSV